MTVQAYVESSKELNQLINLYFSAGSNEDIELKIAGDADERQCLMPLLYIDGDERAKESISADMCRLLKEYHQGEDDSRILLPSNRMKPLDIVKVLMGINSQREAVRRFQQSHILWAKCHEYDYEQMLNVSEACTQDFYCNALAARAQRSEPTADDPIPKLKRKKLEAVEEEEEELAQQPDDVKESEPASASKP